MISSPAALAASLMLRVLWPKNGLAMSATTTPTVVVVPLRVLRAGQVRAVAEGGRRGEHPVAGGGAGRAVAAERAGGRRAGHAGALGDLGERHRGRPTVREVDGRTDPVRHGADVTWAFHFWIRSRKLPFRS